MNSYPQDLIPIIKEGCSEKHREKYYKPPLLPPDEVLTSILNVCYHASFATEEGRRLGFRIILYSPSEHGKYIREDRQNTKYYEKRFRLVLLEKERSLSVAEVIRLAPAAEFKRLLICVKGEISKDKTIKLDIWALLDVGENWWQYIHHETSGGMPPPNYLTVSSTMPGEITISAQGDIIASLKNGKISLPSFGVFQEGPLNTFLAGAQEHLYQETIKALNVTKFDPKGPDNDFPLRSYKYFLERILFYTRQRNHGGTIILVPNYLEKDDTRLTDRVNIKYPSNYDQAWNLLIRWLVNYRKYYDLHFPLWDAQIPYTNANFIDHSMLAMEKEELDEALGDVAETIASLTSVDGAVIINQKFSVLGFGSEVIAASPSLTHVQIYSPTKDSSLVAVESYGTRHRSAFRFCSSFEESMVFIVSQDGDVKVVKREGKQVFLWPNINAGEMGI